jgi:diguanylate cyclase (GGDEF)-like protein
MRARTMTMRNLFRFPKDDPAQALRLRHTLMAFASYVVIIGFVLYCSYAGLSRLPLTLSWALAGLALAINALFYLIIASGWNKRLRDPSMTLVQMTTSSSWLLLVLYFTEEVRGAVLILFLNNFIFGIFRLRTAQFLGAALFVLAGYGVVVALLAKYHPQSVDLRIEFLQWMLLAMALPWFALIGAYISNVRSALRQKNKELEKALATIERLASHDELTGAYSRRFFLDALRREKTRSDREHRTFCLAMLDLDSFKAINDRHGHLAGDDVLRQFAESVQFELRGSDCFARYGGEEFALLLVDTDLAYAAGVLERIRERIERNSFSHVGRTLTVSAGIAQYRLHEELSGTLGRADRALYSAKAAGRNRIEQAEP